MSLPPAHGRRALAERILARRAHRVTVSPPPGESFRWFELDFPSHTGRLTVHPEYELQLIRASRGQAVIGDRVMEFEPGHIALIGTNVPHAVVPVLPEGASIAAASAVAHFSSGWIAGLDGVMPEMRAVTRVLNDSSRGVVLLGPSARRARWEMEAIGRSRGPARVGHLLGALTAFATAPATEKRFVASSLFRTSADLQESMAAEAGLAYILDNLSTDLSVAGAAVAARMSESNFARQFKRVTGATFTDTVRNLRIAQSCRLLERTDAPVAVVARDVGYNNLSNFNRQFLAVMGEAPAAYRRRVRRQ